MALIGEIRKRGTLLLFIIGGALLAFILGDLFSNRGPAQVGTELGSIGGEEINVADYESRVRFQTAAYQQVGLQPSTETTRAIRDGVWNEMLRDNLLMPQLEELGMVVKNEDAYYVTEGEYDNMRYSNNPAEISEFIKNSRDYQNPETGGYDRDFALQQMNYLESAPEYATYWDFQVETMKKARMYNKYNQLLSKSMYVTYVQGQMAYDEQNIAYNVSYVFKDYDEILDEEVSYEEKDLTTYYEQHKGETKYKREARANMRYIRFVVAPTDEDIAGLKEELTEQVDKFKTTKNDSLFAARKSDNPLEVVFDYIPGMANDPAIDAAFANADSNAVIGPFIAGGYVRLAKIVQDTLPQTEIATVRQISIGALARLDSATMDSTARSVFARVNGGEDFATVADEHNPQKNGGLLPAFEKGGQAAQIDSIGHNMPVGSIHLVDFNGRKQIIKVEARGPLYKCYTINARVSPSEATKSEAFIVADDFSNTNKTSEAFEKAANEAGYEIITPSAPLSKATIFVDNLPNSDTWVEWAFTSEAGAVSQADEIGDTIYIQNLVSRYEEGQAELEEVRDAVVLEVIKEKKYEMYKTKMAGSTLDEIAASAELAAPQLNQSVSYNGSSIPGVVGAETDLVGKISAMKEGVMSGPIKGAQGIYVMQLESTTEPVPPTPEDVENLRKQRSSLVSQNAGGFLLESMKRAADVKDMRRGF